MNWHNPNLWLFLIFVILPALQWVAQRIKEKREVAKAAERIRRQKEEVLRTGRAPAEEQAAAAERAQTQVSIEAAKREAIQRRQEQLRELRRKQMQAQAEARARARQTTAGSPRRQQQTRGPAQSPRPSGPPTAPQPAPSSHRAPTPRPQPRPQQQPMPSGQPRSGPSDLERITRQRQMELAQRQAKLQAAAREASLRGESSVRPILTTLRSEHDVSAVDANDATTSGAELLSNLSADDWRRGIVMAEILGKPVCERADYRLF